MSKIKDSYSHFLLIITVLLLPWDTVAGSIAIAVSVVFALYFVFKEKKFKEVFTLKYFAAIAVILTYILGVFYSSDTKYALSFVQTTIPLLFFPFLFIPIKFSQRNIVNIILTFVISYTIRALVVFFFLVREVLYHKLNKNWYFQKIGDLGGFHPTAMGAYSIVSIILLLYLLSKKKNNWFYLLLIFNVGFLFILASRMVIISFLIISVIYLIHIYIKFKSKRKTIWIVSLISIILISIIISNDHDLKYKFLQLKNINNFKYNKYDASSVASRIAKWESAINIYKENNFIIGTGTGDIPKDLLIQFKKIDCLQCRVKKYNNPHNQYLDSLSRNGILGLTFLLLNLIYPIIIAIKSKNIYQLMFMVAFGLIFVSECLLNREKSVQLFGFFYSFFYLLNSKNAT